MTATHQSPAPSSQPRMHQRGPVIQEFGTVKQFPLGLSYDARMFACEQLEVVDALAERVQTLGGVSVGDPRHTAELTSVPVPPTGSRRCRS